MILTKNDLEILLTAAGRAPSGGNIQPWLVDVDTNQLTVKLNPDKLGTVLDVNNYGSLYSLGAFVYNLEIAAGHLGLEFNRHLVNEDDPQSFQINFSFTGKTKPAPISLYKAMLDRHSNRRLHEGKIIPAATYQKLVDLINQNPPFRLDSVFDTDGKNEMATILGKADLIRTKNYKLLQQMMSEIRWNSADAHRTKDGIDIKTMELPGNVDKMLHLMSKFASLAKTVPDIALEKQAWPMLKFSSHLCVLSFKGEPNPLHFFQTGYLMEKFWIHAALQKLSVHPWTVLSFFTIRAKYFPGSFFSISEEALLLKTDQKLRKLLSLPSSYTPAFIFRLSITKPASTSSLRYDWTQYTKFV